ELPQRLDEAKASAGKLDELMIEISASRQLSRRNDERHSSGARPAFLPVGCEPSCPVLLSQRKPRTHDAGPRFGAVEKVARMPRRQMCGLRRQAKRDAAFLTAAIP